VTRMIDDNGQVWKFHPLSPPPFAPPEPFSITQWEWDGLMLKLDKLICAVLNTTETIEEGNHNMELNEAYLHRKLNDVIERLDRLIEVTKEGQRLMLPLMGWEPPPEPIRTPLKDFIPGNPRVQWLVRAGITTVEEVLLRTPQQLLAVRNFGTGSLVVLGMQLESKGYSREE